jgi:hypothetical protein
VIREVGDTQHETYTAFLDGEPTDATVVLTVTDPDGNDTTPSVSHDGVGEYSADFALGTAGLWTWVWEATGAVVDVEVGQVTAVAPGEAPSNYISLAELRYAVGETAEVAPGRDESLLRALSAAARSIDNTTHRRFWPDLVATSRRYDIRSRGRVFVDKRAGTTTLYVDDMIGVDDLVIETGTVEGSWSTYSVPYLPEPLNAAETNRAVEALVFSTLGLPGPLMRLTNRFGWPVVPDEVAQATLMQASRFWGRKSSPEGVAGSAEWGIMRVSRLDPDVRELIKNLILPEFA